MKDLKTKSQNSRPALRVCCFVWLLFVHSNESCVSLFQNVSEHRSDAIRHSHKARIVGVNRVYLHLVLMRCHVKAHSINEINVLIACRTRLQIRGHDHVTAS